MCCGRIWDRVKSICGRSMSSTQLVERTPLPKTIISILFAMLLFNAMAMTMVFAYLPKLVKSFGTSEVNTGYYAGLIASSLFVGRLIFSLVWGYIVDLRGKKFTAILSAFCLMVTTLAFGFSTNFWWAFITRSLQGLSMGLIVASKALLSTICDDSNIALGMSIIISSFSAGLIIGPSLAGFLVFPHQQYPSVFPEDNIFSKYGVLFPNFIIFIGLLVTVTIATKLIPSDKKNKNEEKNYLLDLRNENNNKKKNYVTLKEDEDHQTFKRKSPDTYLEVSIKHHDEYKHKNPNMFYVQIVEPIQSITPSRHNNTENLTWRQRWENSNVKELLSNKWCVLTCVLYGTYSLVAIGFDEIVPLYLATSIEYHGMAFSTSQIGMALLIVSIFLIIIQVTLLTFLATKYGSRKMFIVSILILAFVLPFLPTISNIKNRTTLWVVLSIYLLICRVVIAGPFLALNILINNSVEEHLLGTANGMAMSLSSAGRMIAPTMVGSLFSWSLTNIKGVKDNINPLGFPLNQYFPFLILSFLAILNAIIASRIPVSLDKSMRKPKDEKEDLDQPGNVTNITVGYFTPSHDNDEAIGYFTPSYEEKL